MTEDAEIDWYSNDIATFGDRVAAGREALGLSQKQLARKLGVATKTIDSWEHDISEPRANKLQMLAGILNVSMPWLLTGEGDGVPHPEAGVTSSEVADVLTELRMLKTQLVQSADRVAVLEKRLRAAQVLAAE